MREVASNLSRIQLDSLGRQPHACPAQVKPSWDRLVAAHASVSGLFDTLHVLREHAARSKDKDPRGRLSEDQLDQVRAAIVFTSAATDACLRRLLRDALPTILIPADTGAARRFTSYLHSERLGGALDKDTKTAITSADPRGQLIDLYVKYLAGASVQRWTALRNVRDALGLPDGLVEGADLSDARLKTLDDFFHARNEIAHELDLIDTTGKGSRSRRHRDMIIVGAQCNSALKVIEAFLRATATALKTIGTPETVIPASAVGAPPSQRDGHGEPLVVQPP